MIDQAKPCAVHTKSSGTNVVGGGRLTLEIAFSSFLRFCVIECELWGKKMFVMKFKL